MMPDPNGKLTQADKAKFVAWMNDKAKHHQCPVCATNAWTIGDDLINAMPYTGAGFVIGGPSYPLAFLVCNNCAYTRHFMAVPIGILPASEEKEGGSDVG